MVFTRPFLVLGLLLAVQCTSADLQPQPQLHSLQTSGGFSARAGRIGQPSHHAHRALADTDKVSTPSFSESAGVFIKSATIHVVCDTDGAVISYTDDGTDPVPGSSEVLREGEGIFLDAPGDWIVKAVGSKEGMQDSDVAVLKLSIQEQAQAPQIEISGTRVQAADDVTTYLRTATVTIACDSRNATIYFTTDGSRPVETPEAEAVRGAQLEGTHIYKGAFTWSREGPVTVTAIAAGEGYHRSRTSTTQFLVVAPPIDTTPASLNDDTAAVSPVVTVRTLAVPRSADGRVVHGTAVALSNPLRHLTVVADQKACRKGQPVGDMEALTRLFKPPEGGDAQHEKGSDGAGQEGVGGHDLALMAEWEAYDKSIAMGCQVAIPAGLPCGGYLVTQGGNIVRSSDTPLMSFGLHGNSFVTGRVAPESLTDRGLRPPQVRRLEGADEAWVGGYEGWDRGVEEETANTASLKYCTTKTISYCMMCAYNRVYACHVCRAGVNYVDTSFAAGDFGAFNASLDGTTARLAVGHTASGALLLVQMEGSAELAPGSGQKGPNRGAEEGVDGLGLRDFADVLVALGAVSAIGVPADGTPLLINGTAAVPPGSPCAAQLEYAQASLHMFRVAFGVSFCLGVVSLCYALQLQNKAGSISGSAIELRGKRRANSGRYTPLAQRTSFDEEAEFGTLSDDEQRLNITAAEREYADADAEDAGQYMSINPFGR
ncbi:hypothetical protein JKP88DRAFT_301099 [Tribonema minus]|uniref:Uncharacterized protein n=1 Tax=Tribonema minus TaxID=303371 RepID=A0A835ZFT5_9STRA|nr:hypothetical protein JKP88DRAFT_301099 [Tribonema minus]